MCTTYFFNYTTLVKKKIFLKENLNKINNESTITSKKQLISRMLTLVDRNANFEKDIAIFVNYYFYYRVSYTILW